MAPETFAIGLVWGSALIAFGLVPGLFWGLADGLSVVIENLRSSVFYWPRRSSIRTENDRQDPVWLVAVGALVITLTLLQPLLS